MSVIDTISSEWSSAGPRRSQTQVIGPASRKREPELPPVAAGNPFIRLITAKALAQLERRPVAEVINREWPTDLVLRAASAPATTTTTGWAKELVRTIVRAPLEALGPASAGVQVLQKGLVLGWDGAGQISAPGFVASAANASFVAENQAIPVRALAVGPTLLNPYKLATIAVLSHEMLVSGNAEALIGDALVRACGLALDAVLFGSAAGSAAAPPGLRNGISALTPSASTDAFGAVFEDVTALINALAAVAGPGPYTLVCSPGRAVMIRSRLPQDYAQVGLSVYGSAAVGADLVAIAPAALVCALSPDPDVETAEAGSLVLDTAPPADPQTGGQHKSLFQTDAIAIKIRWPISWALRNSAGISWLTPAWK